MKFLTEFKKSKSNRSRPRLEHRSPPRNSTGASRTSQDFATFTQYSSCIRRAPTAHRSLSQVVMNKTEDRYNETAYPDSLKLKAVPGNHCIFNKTHAKSTPNSQTTLRLYCKSLMPQEKTYTESRVRHIVSIRTWQFTDSEDVPETFSGFIHRQPHLNWGLVAEDKLPAGGRPYPTRQ